MSVSFIIFLLHISATVMLLQAIYVLLVWSVNGMVVEHWSVHLTAVGFIFQFRMPFHSVLSQAMIQNGWFSQKYI